MSIFPSVDLYFPSGHLLCYIHLCLCRSPLLRLSVLSDVFIASCVDSLSVRGCCLIENLAPLVRATSLAHLATFLSRFNLFPFLLFAPSPLLVLLFSSTSPIQHQRRNFNLSLRFVGRSRGASHSRGILRPALSAQRPGCSRRRTPSAVWPLSLTFSLPPPPRANSSPVCLSKHSGIHLSRTSLSKTGGSHRSASAFLRQQNAATQVRNFSQVYVDNQVETLCLPQVRALLRHPWPQADNT